MRLQVTRALRSRVGGLIALAWLALAWLAIAGCASEVSSISGECKIDDDCPASQVCEALRCVAPAVHGPEAVHVEITPPSGSPYVRTQVLSLSLFDPKEAVRLVLPEPTEYEVVVLDADGAPLDAKLTLVGDPRIPGREPDASLDLRAGNARTRVVRLLEGTYRANVQRLDLRPSLATSFVVRPSGGVPITKEFRFAPYRRIYGDVTSSLSTETKLAGVRVLALSEITGLASTATITGTDGRYAIELPDVDDATFRVLAELPPAVQPAWGYEEVVLVDRDADREKRIAVEPTSPAIRGAAKIRVGGAIDGFLAAVGANVTLTATATEGLFTRTYRVTGTTDGSGRLVVPGATEPGLVPVLRGRYLAEVEPAESGPFGHLSTMLDLTAVAPDRVPDVQLLLPVEARVTGSVRSDLGRPVTYATVEISKSGEDGEPEQVSTDADGRFEARLEPGRYLLVVRPSGPSDVGEELPVAVRAIEVKANVAELAEVTVTLPRGVHVSGTVIGAARSEAIAGSKVELFLESEGRAVSLGDVRTDANGMFDALVPETVSP